MITTGNVRALKGRWCGLKVLATTLALGDSFLLVMFLLQVEGPYKKSLVRRCYREWYWTHGHCVSSLWELWESNQPTGLSIKNKSLSWEMFCLDWDEIGCPFTDQLLMKFEPKFWLTPLHLSVTEGVHRATGIHSRFCCNFLSFVKLLSFLLITF